MCVAELLAVRTWGVHNSQRVQNGVAACQVRAASRPVRIDASKHRYTYIYVQAYIHVNRTMYTYVQTYKGRDGCMDGWMEERDEKYMHM